MPSYDHSALGSLLVAAPPCVSQGLVADVARHCFGADRATALAGERDLNFRAQRADGSQIIIKFINKVESVAETRMQIEVLKHLAAYPDVVVPRHEPVVLDAPLPAHLSNLEDSGGNWVKLSVPSDSTAIRVRAYSFLPGHSGTRQKAHLAAWQALGEASARLSNALRDFRHPATHRRFLWDVGQVAQLRPLLDVVTDTAQRRCIQSFLDIFALTIAPRLSTLPHQVIHNDLSPSNVLTDDSGLVITGILDFGDMVFAPRVAEIAIASSYPMSETEDPQPVLEQIVRGYTSITPLSEQEKAVVLDLVLARLIQRIIITSWRAERFPANREYILRSRHAALSSFSKVYELWQARPQEQMAGRTVLNSTQGWRDE